MNILTLVLAAQAVQSQPQQVDYLSVSQVVCCKGAFTLKNVLTSIRLTAPAPGRLKLTMVSDRSWDKMLFLVPIHGGWASYKGIVLEQLPELPPQAYILQSGSVASAVLWDPAAHMYETASVRGRDLLLLRDGSQIVYVSRQTAWDEGGRFHVWLWTKGALDKAASERLLVETGRHLGMPVHLTVGSSPLFWTFASGLPHWLPAFGALSRESIKQATPPIVFDCDWAKDGAKFWCVEKQCEGCVPDPFDAPAPSPPTIPRNVQLPSPWNPPGPPAVRAPSH